MYTEQAKPDVYGPYVFTTEHERDDLIRSTKYGHKPGGAEYKMPPSSQNLKVYALYTTSHIYS